MRAYATALSNNIDLFPNKEWLKFFGAFSYWTVFFAWSSSIL